MAIIGGLLGIIIYLTNPEMILNAENIWIALGIGIVSGASSTGANQIIKQIFKKGEEKNGGRSDSNRRAFAPAEAPACFASFNLCLYYTT